MLNGKVELAFDHLRILRDAVERATGLAVRPTELDRPTRSREDGGSSGPHPRTWEVTA